MPLIRNASRVLTFHRAVFHADGYALFCTEEDGQPTLIRVAPQDIYNRPQRAGRYRFTFNSRPITAAPYDALMETCQPIKDTE